ncbi:ABC transporter ATP-binding protein [Chloroflexota bacterium]
MTGQLWGICRNKEKQIDRSRLRTVWFFFAQCKIQILILLVISVVVSGLEAITISVIYPILNTAFAEGASEGNLVLSLFRQAAALIPVVDEFIAYCFLFLFLALISFVMKYIAVRYRVKFSAGFVEKQQSEIFYKFVKADYQYFIDHKEGEIIYRTTSAPNGLSTLIVTSTELVSQVLLSISIFVLLLSLSWQGTLAVVFVGIIYQLCARYLAEKVSYYSGKGMMEALTEGIVIINETVTGIKQVKVFTIAKEWLQKFVNTMARYWYYHIRVSTLQQILNPALMLIIYIFIGTIAILIKLLVPTDFNELIPIFGIFAFAVFRLVPVLGSISGATIHIIEVLPNIEAIYEVMNQDLSEIKEGNKELDSFKSRIEFDNVSFAYRGRVKLFEDISISFDKGSTTAIVGRSGSGKTTIINSILRLFDVSNGAVNIDGVDIREYRIDSWLSKVGYVSQDTFIFNDTVRNNITFHSDYSDEEVIRASKYADAHSFITSLPDGYDTYVGDKGMGLSGGQRQRIAVARAVIRNPEILIFDEATNALDNISETAVQKAIDELSKDHTVIIIAHRLSTIVNADKIIVVGDGRILEQGTHDELLKNKGAYWELYRNQPV